MTIRATDLLDACTVAVKRLRGGRSSPLAYLLLTGTSENTIRDLLACELLKRDFLPARDWDAPRSGKRRRVDIALMDPRHPQENPVCLIELKCQLSKDCRGDGTYPYLVNVKRDLDSRRDLGIRQLAVVLFTHVRSQPPTKFAGIIRFHRALHHRWRECGDGRLERFRDQLYRDFCAHEIAPSTSAMCRIDAGEALGTKVELACWVVEPKTGKPVAQP